MFPDLTKTLSLAFARTPIKLSKRFNDFDLVSRSQVRIINCKFLFVVVVVVVVVFRFLSTIATVV